MAWSVRVGVQPRSGAGAVASLRKAPGPSLPSSYALHPRPPAGPRPVHQDQARQGSRVSQVFPDPKPHAQQVPWPHSMLPLRPIPIWTVRLIPSGRWRQGRRRWGGGTLGFCIQGRGASSEAWVGVASAGGGSGILLSAGCTQLMGGLVLAGHAALEVLVTALPCPSPGSRVSLSETVTLRGPGTSLTQALHSLRLLLLPPSASVFILGDCPYKIWNQELSACRTQAQRSEDLSRGTQHRVPAQGL